MVRRGLCPTREQALAAVEAGRVLVGGAPAAKAARLVAAGEAILLTGPPPRYVSRGGEKLEAALDHFAVDVRDRLALDAGASTGGFTDCLLQRGARSVVAVDVGRAQLHERLRADPRVRSLERTNIRSLTLEQAIDRPFDVRPFDVRPFDVRPFDVRPFDVRPFDVRPFDVVVADLSFISLRTVADALVDRLAGPGADVVVLIKPQFEAGRRRVSAGRGVVRDPDVWADVLETVCAAVVAHGAAMMGVMVSPLKGADGNVEFLAHFVAHQSATAGSPVDLAAVARAGAGPAARSS